MEFTSKVVNLLDTEPAAYAARSCGMAVTVKDNLATIYVTEKAEKLLTPAAFHAWVSITYMLARQNAESDAMDKREAARAARAMWKAMDLRLSKEDVLSVERCAMAHAFNTEEKLNAVILGETIAALFGSLRLRLWAAVHSVRSIVAIRRLPKI